MPRVVVINHLTLDGVMQAPGRRDEDTRGGFDQGGWASSRMVGDEVIGAAMPLPWPNSTLLRGDFADAVRALKQEPGEELHVMGSGELIPTLMRHNLIDEYMLLIHPLVVGSGRRLFADTGARAALLLVDAKASSSGVVIATYRQERG